METMTYSCDESIGDGFTSVSKYRADGSRIDLLDCYTCDSIWGGINAKEYSALLFTNYNRRLKYYQTLSTADFCKHINMRRKNIPQNRKNSKKRKPLIIIGQTLINYDLSDRLINSGYALKEALETIDELVD